MRRYDRPATVPDEHQHPYRTPLTEGDFANAVFRATDAPWVTIWRVDPMHVGIRLPDPPPDLAHHLREIASMGLLLTVEAA